MTIAVGNKKFPKGKTPQGLPRVLMIQLKFIPKKPVKKVIGRKISETIVSRFDLLALALCDRRCRALRDICTSW